jgi:metal-dependent hydrolase (beta-lactamase superfamily II)
MKMCSGKKRGLIEGRAVYLLLILWLLPAFISSGYSQTGDQGRIAFNTYGDSLYVMGADGSNLQLLIAGGYCPAFSPDGTRIAFQRGGHGGDKDIYVMNVSGNGVRNLTLSPSCERHAAWSPDGNLIAFQSDRDGNPELYVMDADGSDWRRLTNNPAEDVGPSWSPDGHRIAFYSIRDGNWEIYIADLDNGAVRRLTNTPEKELAPAWSPDGTKIAFCSGRMGVFEGNIHVINPDGTNERALTDAEGMQEHPAWSPDGSHIAFQEMVDGSFEICTIDSAGDGWKNVSNHEGHDYWPTWGPAVETVHTRDSTGVLLTLKDVQLQIVYDNNPYADGLEVDPGFSCLVRVGDTKVLFDAGRIPSIMASNMTKLGIKPESIDKIVISHNHSDHVCGLSALLDAGAKPEVFVLDAMPDNLSQRAWDLVVGTIASAREHTGRLVDVSEPIQVCPNVFTTGPMGSRIPEQALIVRTNAGLVVITGCGHPGVVAQVEKARNQLKQEVLLVMGGFHLLEKDMAMIEAVVDGLLPLTRYVAPCHCSGPEARELFHKSFGDRFLELGVGKCISLEDLAD